MEPTLDTELNVDYRTIFLFTVSVLTRSSVSAADGDTLDIDRPFLGSDFMLIILPIIVTFSIAQQIIF